MNLVGILFKTRESGTLQFFLDNIFFRMVRMQEVFTVNKKTKSFIVEEMKWTSLLSCVSLELTLVIVICLQYTHSQSNGKSTLRLVHIVSTVSVEQLLSM